MQKFENAMQTDCYTTKKREQRRRALQMIRKGATMAQAARELDESHQLIRYWVKSAGVRPKRYTRGNSK
jgi:transposase-like protein